MASVSGYNPTKVTPEKNEGFPPRPKYYYPSASGGSASSLPPLQEETQVSTDTATALISTDAVARTNIQATELLSTRTVFTALMTALEDASERLGLSDKELRKRYQNLTPAGVQNFISSVPRMSSLLQMNEKIRQNLIKEANGYVHGNVSGKITTSKGLGECFMVPDGTYRILRNLNPPHHYPISKLGTLVYSKISNFKLPLLDSGIRGFKLIDHHSEDVRFPPFKFRYSSAKGGFDLTLNADGSFVVSQITTVPNALQKIFYQHYLKDHPGRYSPQKDAVDLAPPEGCEIFGPAEWLSSFGCTVWNPFGGVSAESDELEARKQALAEIAQMPLSLRRRVHMVYIPTHIIFKSAEENGFGPPVQQDGEVGGKLFLDIDPDGYKRGKARTPYWALVSTEHFEFFDRVDFSALSSVASTSGSFDNVMKANQIWAGLGMWQATDSGKATQRVTQILTLRNSLTSHAVVPYSASKQRVLDKIDLALHQSSEPGQENHFASSKNLVINSLQDSEAWRKPRLLERFLGMKTRRIAEYRRDRAELDAFREVYGFMRETAPDYNSKSGTSWQVAEQIAVVHKAISLKGAKAKTEEEVEEPPVKYENISLNWQERRLLSKNEIHDLITGFFEELMLPY